MNGRIFDPAIARFISADPILQDPSNLQNHNLYSYINNNPHLGTDPSGYCISDGKSDCFAQLSTATHVALGAASFCPSGCGSVFSVIDAAVYYAEGDKKSAGIGIIAAVGGVITDAGAIKAALTVADKASDVANAIKTVSTVGEANAAIKAMANGVEAAAAANRADNAIFIEKQAAELIPLNAGKNRVTIKSEGEKLEIDLAGKSHDGIPTPHTKESNRNFNAPKEQGVRYNTSKGEYRSSTQRDIRTARKYLDSKNK